MDDEELLAASSDSLDEFDEDEKELLKSRRGNKPQLEGADGVLEFDSEDDDADGDDDDGEVMSDIDMGSDLDTHDDERLPDDRAWGQDRKTYYHTDFVDQDYAGTYAAEEAEAAELEEQEARNIQKRLLEQLCDADFSLGDIVDSSINSTVGEKTEIITTDLSQLTKRQKLDLFHKESPEFSSLVEDFQSKLNEARERIIPVLNLVRDGKLKPSPATKFVETTFQIILNYCTNIVFYLLLKTKRISVKDHPVLKALYRYRQLLTQLQPVYEGVVSPQMSRILELNSSSSIEKIDAHVVKKKQPKKKVLNILNKTTAEKSTAFVEKEMVSGSHSDDDDIPVPSIKNDDEEVLGSRSEISEHTSEKRAITYEMAKNKGLTPKRSKEQRNPRVKHRNKYKKAKIRRRGQVRTPRAEIPVYGGEPTGIKIGLKKGIKLK